MRIIVIKERCDLCGTCVGVCPENVIALFESELVIDETLCTLCRHCEAICPMGALEVEG